MRRLLALKSINFEDQPQEPLLFVAPEQLIRLSDNRVPLYKPVDPEKMVIKRLREIMEDKLTPRQREVLYLRFGFGDSAGLSFSQIAEKLGIGKSRAHAIYNRAYYRLLANRGYILDGKAPEENSEPQNIANLPPHRIAELLP